MWDTFEEKPGKNDKKIGSRKSTYFHEVHPHLKSTHFSIDLAPNHAKLTFFQKLVQTQADNRQGDVE